MDEYDVKADAYYERFSDEFPLFMVRDIDKAIEMIDKCLESGKTAVELYPDVFDPSVDVLI